LAIQFQLGTVSLVWSLIYRFSLAFIVLWIYAKATRLNLQFSKKQHVLMFFSSIILMNIFNARIFLKTPLSGRVFIAAILGIVGLLLVFSFQFTLINEHQLPLKECIFGVIFCLGGTLFASFGNIISALSQRHQRGTKHSLGQT